MAARPKQQRIDPRKLDEAVAKRDGGTTGAVPKSTPAAAKAGKPARPATSTKPGAKLAPAPVTSKSAAKARSDAKSTTRPPAAKRGRPGAPRPAAVTPATARDWIGGARLQTLSLAIAPVALGSGAATLVMANPWDHWARAVLCLIVALALQIGVNFANDYSDGIRGTDAQRQGPQRLVGSGKAKPATVRTVAFAFFGIAAVAGLILTIVSAQWWLLAVGAVCIVAAWFYTGGRKPYGYAGFGELVVFVFFGLVATAGTMFVQVGTVNVEAWVSGAAVGFLACAVLMVNNLRDRERDALVGKRTLAVRIGDRASRVAYVVFMVLPFVALGFFVLFYDSAAFVFFTLLAALPAIIIVIWAKTAAELVTALRLTVLSALIYGLALGAVFIF